MHQSMTCTLLHTFSYTSWSEWNQFTNLNGLYLKASSTYFWVRNKVNEITAFLWIFIHICMHRIVMGKLSCWSWKLELHEHITCQNNDKYLYRCRHNVAQRDVWFDSAKNSIQQWMKNVLYEIKWGNKTQFNELFKYLCIYIFSSLTMNLLVVFALYKQNKLLKKTK